MKNILNFTVPKYIKQILGNAEFKLDGKDWIPGYTIKLHKESPYQMAGLLYKKAERLVQWAKSFNGNESAELVSYPVETHYCDQYAVINIFDPLMVRIEKFIGK